MRLYHLIKNRITAFILRIVADQSRIKKETLIRSLGHFGSFSFINGDCTFYFPENIYIGNNVHIGDNAFFSGRGGIEIHDNTHISINCTIFSANHNFKGSRLPYNDEHILKKVSIGQNVWIAANVTLVPGVTIGEGAIIGAGVTVINDVKRLSIVVNDGMKIISKRDEEDYERLLKSGSFGGVDGKSLQNDPF